MINHPGKGETNGWHRNNQPKQFESHSAIAIYQARFLRNLHRHAHQVLQVHGQQCQRRIQNACDSDRRDSANVVSAAKT
jgi:hypothetical protein